MTRAKAAKARGLDPHCHEGGDVGGRAFIYIRGPHVEGHGGHLEAEAHDDEGQAQHGQGLGNVGKGGNFGGHFAQV